MLVKNIFATCGFLIFLSLFFGVDGYLNKAEMLKFYSLSKSHPLKTAGREHGGYIPRLDPGLRLLKPQIDAKVAPFSTFSLDWLKNNEEIKVEPIRVPLDALFSKVLKGMATFATRLADFAKRIIKTVAFFLPTLLSLAAVTRTVPTANAMNFPFKLPFQTNVLSCLKSYQSLSPTQKLATTPLFYVCNSRGGSFLQEDHQSGCLDQRIVTYFMSSDDATVYLSEMAQMYGGNPKEFKIMTTSLEKVMSQIKEKKQSRKYGIHPIDVLHRIQPSSKQCEHADGILSKDADTQVSLTIPMFSAEGLMIRRANGEVVSPYYFALEDLNEDWEKTMGANRPKEPNVMVTDFAEVLTLSNGMSRELAGAALPASKLIDALKNVGVVPPRREIEMIRNFYRNKSFLKDEYSRAKFRQPQQ